MIKAKIVDQKENGLLFSWDGGQNCEYCLQVLSDLKEWKTLYRGLKTSYNVQNLAPSEVYTFRIKSESEWHTFTSATNEGIPYTTRHLYSAMHSQKYGMIRKIVKMRYKYRIVKPELLEIENKKSNTPLIQAVTENDTKMVNLLLHLGANINTPLMYSGKTPLLVAVSHGFVDLAKFLVNKGASLKDVDVNGVGVMHSAVNSENLEMIRYFVDLGLNINVKDRNGLNPLLRAVILETDEEIVKFLIKNGADVSDRDENGFDFKIHQLLNKKDVISVVPVPKFIFL